jgi:putative alpha-1,2-mannosidase
MFAIPHDPYGLLSLPGQDNFAQRLLSYCTNECWFNDYQTIYPYMLYYAGLHNEAQRILRQAWVPMFESGIMYEGVKPKPPHNGWQTHYTGNSGWLLCSMLGLYPGGAPPGQFFISSPSLTKAVIHRGKKEIVIETKNSGDENIYIRSIKVDGRVYPAYMIPARRLVAGAKIEIELGNDPAQTLGDLYIGSSDGFILEATLVTPTHLQCAIEAAAAVATTKVFSRVKPAKVLVNGKPDDHWSYDEPRKAVTIYTSNKANIDVFTM